MDVSVGGVDVAPEVLGEAAEVEVVSAVRIELGVAAVSVAAWIIGDVG